MLPFQLIIQQQRMDLYREQPTCNFWNWILLHKTEKAVPPVSDCRLFLNKPLRVLQRKETIRFTRVWSNSSFSCSCGDSLFFSFRSVVVFLFVDKESKKLQIEFCRLSGCSAGGAIWGLPI